MQDSVRQFIYSQQCTALVTGMSAGANGSVLLCVVNASASRSVGSSTATLVQLSLRTSSRTNTNASETHEQSMALLRYCAELPSECSAQCSLTSDTLQSTGEGERVYVLCGKKVRRFLMNSFGLIN